MEEYLEIVKLLIKKGADIHRNNDIFLKHATENKNYKVVKFLLENGADPLVAFGNDQLKIFELLVNHVNKFN
jgi:ankyrin repeat protein